MFLIFFLILIIFIIIFCLCKKKTFFNNLNYKYNLVILAMFKNEKHAIKEWLEHYIKEGVEHFYLIDDMSTDNWENEIQNFSITLYKNKNDKNQLENYNYFLNEIKKTSKWVLVVDLDEFMYSRNNFKTISQYLNTVDEKIGQINVKWKMFGSNNHINQPKSIISGFTKRNYILNDLHCKAIVRTKYLINFDIHYHKHSGKDIYLPDLGQCNFKKERPKNREKYCKTIKHFNFENEPLHLNHYPIQSLNFFKTIKMTRGDSLKGKNPRDLTYFKNYDNNYIYDDELKNKKY